MSLLKILKRNNSSLYTEETEKKVKKDGPFDMFKNFWVDSEWNKYNKNQKSNSFFMINRIMSIKLPEEAAMMSRYGIDGGNMVEFWRRLMKKQTKSAPSWLYTKTKGMKKADELKFDFDDEVYEYFFELNKCSKKDMLYAKKTNPSELYSELKEIKKMMESYKK